MKFRIGYRTIKTAVGTAASILIAQQLGLHNFASAGIINNFMYSNYQKKITKNGMGPIFSMCFGDAVFSPFF